MYHFNDGSNLRRLPRRLGVLAVALAVCASFSGPVAAQGATSSAVTSPTGNPYRACTDGTSNEDQATCMKEAAAAKAEAQRGQLTNDGDSFRRNALERCDALPGDQREACRLRIKGAGTTSGSVAGGGIVREVTVQDPTPGAAAPMPMPMRDGGATGSGSAGTTMDGAAIPPR